MPTRPVPADDDEIAQQVVAASHHTGQAYAGRLPPGMQGVSGPFPASRPMGGAGMAPPPLPPVASPPSAADVA
eukprot:13191361-Alexandrium_andersonii.AAC.1